jgi:hypothetical protein
MLWERALPEVPMPSRARPTLTVRVLRVAVADAEREQRQVLAKIGEALADQLIEEARAEAAARLGVAPEAIDRERGALDERMREYIDSVGTTKLSTRVGAK